MRLRVRCWTRQHHGVSSGLWRSSLRLLAEFRVLLETRLMKTFGVVMIDAYHRACWKPTWGVFGTTAHGFRERYSYLCFCFLRLSIWGSHLSQRWVVEYGATFHPWPGEIHFAEGGNTIGDEKKTTMSLFVVVVLGIGGCGLWCRFVDPDLLAFC